MRKSIFSMLAIMAISAFVITGCNRPPSGTETTEKPSKMTDSDLETRIKARLGEDAQLRAADLGVKADVDRKEVKLSGTVGSEALRTRAVEIARGSYPGVIITDKIDVKPAELSRAEYTDERASEERTRAKERGETIGQSTEDAWVHSKIVAKMIGNSATPSRNINVDVDNGVVTLRGTVETAEAKIEAERISKETDGVKRVNNQIKVAKKS